MNELDKKILRVCGWGAMLTKDVEAIKLFISKCSISEFEKLKDLEYDISLNEKVG